ncbi:MAG TPA: CapA family protein, partial [Clostridiales bacterium]|nr:CapA family protein [Clostridiales bacterium]
IFAFILLIGGLAAINKSIVKKDESQATVGGSSSHSQSLYESTFLLTEKDASERGTALKEESKALTETSERKSDPQKPEIIDLGYTNSDVVLAFAGDINLSGEWENSPMRRYKRGENTIADFIDPKLVEKMQKANILVVNNEFAFSNRGEKQNKNYTFRADPENVFVYKELGVDVATLANNHIYDYKREALLDTISTLKAAGITPIGAGENIEEAKRAAYFKINGKVFAFVSAGRTESWFHTPAAGKNSAGILDAYGTQNCIEAIKDAKKHSDYVFLCIHWGNEGSHQAAPEQLTNGKLYIDAGADAVIGTHPHLLQGMEFYKGRFIAYSLGNFWFNMKNLQTGLLELVISPDGKISPYFTPCQTKEGKTFVEKDETGRRQIFDLIESVSPGNRIRIDENSRVHEK